MLHGCCAEFKLKPATYFLHPLCRLHKWGNQPFRCHILGHCCGNESKKSIWAQWLLRNLIDPDLFISQSITGHHLISREQYLLVSYVLWYKHTVYFNKWWCWANEIYHLRISNKLCALLHLKYWTDNAECSGEDIIPNMTSFLVAEDGSNEEKQAETTLQKSFQEFDECLSKQVNSSSRI